MSSNNPPIIRSNAPFKVEVSAGSLNAGGKKNGVLPGQASGQQRDMAFDFNNEASKDESHLAPPETPSPDQLVSDSTSVSTNNTLISDAANPANLIQLEESLPSLTPPVGFVSPGAQGPNHVLLDAPSTLDNTLKIEVQASSSNTPKLAKDEAGSKNAIEIPVEHSVQAVVKLIMEHPDTPEKVKILIKQNRSNPVLLDDPKAQDNVAKLEHDRPEDNLQVLMPDAPDEPNRFSIDQDTERSPTSKFDDPLRAPHQARFTPDLQSDHREAVDESAPDPSCANFARGLDWGSKPGLGVGPARPTHRTSLGVGCSERSGLEAAARRQPAFSRARRASPLGNTCAQGGGRVSRCECQTRANVGNSQCPHGGKTAQV